eukprot:1237352-Rhodomonas_salina.2
MEFNKVLEKNGFQLVCFRASTTQITDGDIYGCSFYHFGGRLWRDPDDAVDMVEIAKAWPSVHAFSACTLEEMVTILRKVIAAKAAFMSKTVLLRVGQSISNEQTGLSRDWLSCQSWSHGDFNLHCPRAEGGRVAWSRSEG